MAATRSVELLVREPGVTALKIHRVFQPDDGVSVSAGSGEC
tara:strand:- start:187 stop:309 length:123 start_codon:yes stop_codon:yes gene_type:complete